MGRAVSESDIERVRQLRAAGKSFSQIGEALGRSRGSIAKIVWRRIVGKREGPKPSGAPPRIRKRETIQHPKTWTERVLIETWTERKARRAREAANV